MASDVPYRPSRLQDSALRWGPRIAVGTVLAAAAINWAGWATGIETLTRGFPSWPQMTPWSALLVALSGAAILLQTGRPTPARVWAGRALAALVGVVAATFLAEYAAGTSFSLDQVWFPDAVTSHQASWPGRPSPQTAGSVLLLSAANGLTRVDRRWTADVWALGLAAVALTPFVAIAAYMFDAVSLTRITPSTGMGISTALCLVLLVTAAVSARPDRNPLAWLLRRPDRWSLVRLLGVVAGLPIVTGLSRVGWLHLGLPDTPAWVLSIAVGTVVVGAATFYLCQHEQMLLIEKQKLSRERAEAERERAEAEARYRILADNSVDVVLRLRGTEIVWISPSVEESFGDPPHSWVGTNFLGHVHPDDIDRVAAALHAIAADHVAANIRFRFRGANGRYHWVDGRGKPFIDADGNIDGTTGSLRLIDVQVEAERKLERLARVDTLTGLTNRAETITRLEAALVRPRSHGLHLGVLFCDIDNFKSVNDTWGHAAGDVVLATMAERVRDCVRAGDTVGRMGGDEIVVLLPGLHDLDEAARIAETVRLHAAEPIECCGETMHVTLSIGVTLAAPGESADAITARADAAMYQAKSDGRNRVSRL